MTTRKLVSSILCSKHSLPTRLLPSKIQYHNFHVLSRGSHARTISRNFSVSIDKNSWAADRLIEAGEDLPEGAAKEEVVVTAELLSETPEHVKKLGEQVLALNVLEVNEFLNSLQSRMKMPDELFYGGGGGGGGGSGGAAGGDAAEAEPVKEKEAFDVKLKSVDPKSKIKVIKEVRATTGLGLKEAKELVEKAPCVVKDGLKKDEAEALMKALVDVGADVELV